jgi:hypothetical protein
VSTSTPDTTVSPRSEIRTRTLTADYVVVPDRSSRDEAVYKVEPGASVTERTGTLVHTCDGSASEFVSGLESMGATVERLDLVHVIADGTGFPKTLDLTAPDTAETALAARAASLYEQADREDHNDALGGGWGNAGHATREKAKAFEEALEIVRRFQ